jgi:hypothetical protein
MIRIYSRKGFHKNEIKSRISVFVLLKPPERVLGIVGWDYCSFFFKSAINSLDFSKIST